MKFVLFLIFFVLTGCAGVVDNYHRQLDRGSEKQKTYYKNSSKRDKFSHLRNKGQERSTKTQKSLYPQVKRLYKARNTIERRVQSDDMNDTGNSASLWAGRSSDTNLFLDDQKITHGDIILIQVMGDLKQAITVELKRVFPDQPSLSSKKKGKKKEGETAEAAPVKKDDPAPTSASKVYDKISSVVIEEIKGNYLVLKGQKQLLYKNRKHTVEVQALVSRKEIENDDSIKSSKIMEQTITVIN